MSIDNKLPNWKKAIQSDRKTQNISSNKKTEGFDAIDQKASEYFGAKSWAVVKRNPQYRKRVEAYIQKREKLELKNQKLNIHETEIQKRLHNKTLKKLDGWAAKGLDKFTLGFTKVIREKYRGSRYLNPLVQEAKKLDEEGMSLAYDLFHEVSRYNLEKTSNDTVKTIDNLQQDEVLFILKKVLRDSKNLQSKNISDKISVHYDALAKHKLSILDVFTEKEIKYLSKKRMIVVEKETGRWIFEYPKAKKLGFIQKKLGMYQKEYNKKKEENIYYLKTQSYSKHLMDEMEAHRRLNKVYSLTGKKTWKALSRKTLSLTSFPRLIGGTAMHPIKKIAYAMGIIETASGATSPILGPIGIGFNTLNAIGNASNVTISVMQGAESLNKKNISKKYYKKYQFDPENKELAAVAKSLSKHHNYREDIFGAFIHSNKALLSVAGATAGAIILGVAIAGSAGSMGAAAPAVLGGISLASLSLSAAWISYKVGIWANKEIRSGRWKDPHEKMEKIQLIKEEIQALRSNNEKEIDPEVYNNDPEYKLKLEKTESYKTYLYKNQHRPQELVKKEALLHARMQRLHKKLEQGSGFDRYVGKLQRVPLLGQGIKYVYGGPHYQKTQKNWANTIQNTVDLILVEQAKNINNEKAVFLNDYERGVFRMHPRYNELRAKASTEALLIENPLLGKEEQARIKEKTIQEQENLAFELLIKEKKEELITQKIEENLKNLGVFKKNPNLITRAAQLIASAKKGDTTLSSFLELEFEKIPDNKKEKILPDISIKNLQDAAFSSVQKEKTHTLEKTFFGKHILEDLKKSKNPDVKTDKYFNLENFESVSGFKKMSKETPIIEEIKRRHIERSDNYTTKVILKNLRQEQIFSKDNNYHAIDLELPWAKFIKELGASKEDIQSLLVNTRNQNVSELLLKKIIMRDT